MSKNKEEMAAYLMDHLADLGAVTSKKMFGGVGIFLDGVMFAKVSGDGTPFLRVDDTNRADFEAHGNKQFYSGDKKKGMPYYEIPSAVLDDADQLVSWGRKAHGVAVANKKK